MFKGIRIKYCIVAVLSSAFLAFGLYHVHSLSGVTEGGVIGLNLLLDHWFHISPSITSECCIERLIVNIIQERIAATISMDEIIGKEFRRIGNISRVVFTPHVVDE